MVSKKEKILSAIRKEKISEVPFGFWTHLPGIDLDAKKLADATYDFYKKYDLDFIKTMNNGMYAIEDYGCKIDYSEIEKGGVAKLISTTVNAPEDWPKVGICSVEEGSLKRELDSVKMLKEKVGDEAPIIFTVFSPITTAAKLSADKIFTHIREGHGSEIKKALENISKTTINLIKELEKIGVDGIFFAAQTCSYDKTDRDTFLEYGKPYDIKVLEAANNMWFNVIHAHGNNIMMDIIRDYPVDVFNWHGWETLPKIDQAQIETDKCIMTGIARPNITNCLYNEISNEIYETIKLTNGRGIILTPGCVIRYPVEEKALIYVKKEIEFFNNKILGGK